MSIHNTKVSLIKTQITELQNELNDLVSKGEDLSQWSDSLSRKYKHLSKTSNTLFKYILNESTKPNFDKKHFDTTINMMLSGIEKIQNSEVSQYDASVQVGTHLANKFFPRAK